jgi:hypothetical protein
MGYPSTEVFIRCRKPEPDKLVFKNNTRYNLLSTMCYLLYVNFSVCKMEIFFMSKDEETEINFITSPRYPSYYVSESILKFKSVWFKNL